MKKSEFSEKEILDILKDLLISPYLWASAPSVSEKTGITDHPDNVEVPLRETEIPTIAKIIAQKDIRFSNSPVEAINKIVKRYLRHY